MILNVGGRACGHGFDWSIYQPPRDHRGDGQDFAVSKATEGNGYRDPRYRDHVSTFDAARLLHGAYHFARPSGYGYADGQQEAALLLATLAPSERFVVLDLEATVLSALETANYVLGFWDEVIRSGRFPRRDQRVTYVGKWFSYVHTARISEVSVLWIASYTAGYTPNVSPERIALPAWSVDLWPEGWALWQYSSSGTVAGVHPSDVNVATWAWLNSVAGATATPSGLEPFTAPERTDMGQPVYETTDGGLYYLADAPGTPDGVGWRWIRGTEQANHLAIAGRVELARVCKVGVGAGKPPGRQMDPNAVDVIDETWNAFPVLEPAPTARP